MNPQIPNFATPVLPPRNTAGLPDFILGGGRIQYFHTQFNAAFVTTEGIFPTMTAIQGEVGELRSLLEHQQGMVSEILNMVNGNLSLLTQVRIEVATLCSQKNVSISTLNPDPYILLKKIPVNIRSSEGSFVATFFDANISTSGDTEEEAFSNLRSLILDTLEMLTSEPKEHLGPEPSRQLAVLRTFLERLQ